MASLGLGEAIMSPVFGLFKDLVFTIIFLISYHIQGDVLAGLLGCCLYTVAAEAEDEGLK